MLRRARLTIPHRLAHRPCRRDACVWRRRSSRLAALSTAPSVADLFAWRRDAGRDRRWSVTTRCCGARRGSCRRASADSRTARFRFRRRRLPAVRSTWAPWIACEPPCRKWPRPRGACPSPMAFWLGVIHPAGRGAVPGRCGRRLAGRPVWRLRAAARDRAGPSTNHHLHVEPVGHRQRAVDRRRRGAPVLVQLQAGGTGADHLLERGGL